MSISEFKTEFSVLLNRYAILTSPTDESSENNTTITTTTTTTSNHRELLNAIQDTLRQVLNVKLQYLEEATLKTPANNEIVIATPDAPDVLRIDYNQTNRYEAEKRCTEINLSNFNGLPTHREETRVEVLDNEIQADNTNNNNNKEVKNANLSTTSVQKESSTAANSDFHQKFNLGLIVEETQQNVQKVMSNLQRMANILTPEIRPEPHAVRRLSSILNDSSTKKPSALNQSHHHLHHTTLRSTINRAKAARRSLATVTDDVVTTPTTSRPSHIPVPPSTSSTTSSTMLTKKSATGMSKLAQHSVSLSSFDKPKSPVKPAKNPKYAHVQSTIPKANHVAKKKTTT